MDWQHLWVIPGAVIAAVLGVFSCAYAWYIEVGLWIDLLEHPRKKEENMKEGVALIIACAFFAEFLYGHQVFLQVAHDAVLLWVPAFAAYVVHRKILGMHAIRGFMQRWLVSSVMAIFASIMALMGEEQLVDMGHVSSWAYGCMIALCTLGGYLFCIATKGTGNILRERGIDRSDIVSYVLGGWVGFLLTDMVFAGTRFNFYALLIAAFMLGVQLLCGIAAAATISRLANMGNSKKKL
jgi:hypothetical protein